MIEVKISVRAQAAMAEMNRLDKLTKSVESVADKLNAKLLKTAAITASIADNMARAASYTKAMATGSTGAIRPASVRSSRPGRAADPFANNPLAGAQAFAPNAAAGNTYAIRMFNRYANQYRSAQAGYMKANAFLNGGGNPQSLTSINAAMNTRFSSNGKGGFVGNVLGSDIMRLLASGQRGQLAKLLGNVGGTAGVAASGGGAAGIAGIARLAGPIGLVVAGLGLLRSATVSASERLNRLAAIAVSGGQRGAGQASRIEAALGLSPGAVAGIGENLGSGYGPIAAGRAGVSPYGGPFGDMNYNQKGTAVARTVAYSKTFEDARRTAALAGSPELAKLQMLPKELKDQIFRPMHEDAVAQREAVEYQTRVAVLSERSQRLMNMLLTPALRILNLAMEKVIQVMDWIIDKLNMGSGGAFGGIKSPAEVAREKQQQAVQANTEAVKANTKAYREGTYGGGERSIRATPSGLIPGGPGDRNYRTVPIGVL